MDNALFAALVGAGAALAHNFMDWVKLRNIPKKERPSTFEDTIYRWWFFGTPIVAAFFIGLWEHKFQTEDLLQCAINGFALEAFLSKIVAATTPSSSDKG